MKRAMLIWLGLVLPAIALLILVMWLFHGMATTARRSAVSADGEAKGNGSASHAQLLSDSPPRLRSDSRAPAHAGGSDGAPGATLAGKECLALIQDCLALGKAGAIVDCLSQLSDAPHPERVWELLCTAHIEHGPDLPLVALGEVLLKCSPERAVDYFAACPNACPGFPFPVDAFFSAVQYARERDSGWYSRFLKGLGPDVLFGRQGDAYLVRLTGLLAANGEADMAVILDDAARGEYGISTEAMSQAILQATIGREDAWSAITLIETVLASEHLDDHVEAVSMVVQLLLSPQTWPDGDPDVALTYVESLLGAGGDKSAIAAASIAARFSARSPRPEISQERWDGIWSLCQTVRRTAR